MIGLVTGANAGMGYWISRGLAQQGARVVMVCRDATRGQVARDRIAAETGNPQVEVLLADLASLDSIRRLAHTVQERHAQVHVLVNNVGAHIQERRVTADGIEMNLMINHLSSFLLTNLLLDTLRASAPGRIVSVASNAMTPSIDVDDLQSERRFEPWQAYGQAKLAMVLTTYALARRLAGSGVTVNALHPGMVGTDIVADVAPRVLRPFSGLIKRFLLTPEQGAQAALHLATSPTVAGVSGAYFKRTKQGRSVAASYDQQLQEAVWMLGCQLVGINDTMGL